MSKVTAKRKSPVAESRAEAQANEVAKALARHAVANPTVKGPRLVPTITLQPVDVTPSTPWPGFDTGDAVLYRGEVWYADGFMGANFVRIREHARRVTEGPGDVPETVMQSVPVKAVQKLPEERLGKTRYHPVKTEKDMARKERTKTGQTSVGDGVAALLEGKTYEQMCAIVAKYISPKVKDAAGNWVKKYAHLDAGRRRMVLSNILRAWVKRGGKLS